MPDKVELMRAFQMFDSDKSGTLTKDEVCKVLSRPVGGKPSTFTPEMAAALVDKYDANGDGVLDYDEFIDAWAQGIAPTPLAQVVFDEKKEFVLQDKFFSIKGDMKIYDGDGTQVIKAVSRWTLGYELDITDMDGNEICQVVEKKLAMSNTFRIKRRGETLLTVRAKMFTLEGYIYVYEGKAEFDFSNNTKANKMFTLKGFGVKVKNWFSAEIMDSQSDDKPVAKVSEALRASSLLGDNTYMVTIEPGYDAGLVLGIMIACDKIRAQNEGGGS